MNTNFKPINKYKNDEYRDEFMAHRDVFVSKCHFGFDRVFSKKEKLFLKENCV